MLKILQPLLEALQLNAERKRYALEGEQRRERNLRLQGLSPVRAATLIPSLGIPPVGSSTIWLVDLAGIYNGVPDYAKLKARGCRGVIIKAADGTLTGKLLKENILAARAAGMEVVGVYFWLYPTARLSASLQGNAWWNIVKEFNLDIFFCDYEWTSWSGQPANPNWSDFLAVAAVFEKVSGKRLDVYSAPGYIAEHPVNLGTHRLWIANYNTLKPNTNLPYILWQCSEEWPGEELGFNPNDSRFEDGNICPLSEEEFTRVFKQGALPPAPTVKHHIAEGNPADLDMTPSQEGVLPYRRLADLMTERHWTAGMNAGAGGQDLGDAVTFHVNGLSAYRGTIYSQSTGWGTLFIDPSGNLSETRPASIYTALPYSRRLVLADGTINSDLDRVKQAGWNVLGMRAGRLVMLVTEGREGEAGYTQFEVAGLAKNMGLMPAWLCDSGHPCNFQNGTEVYSAYGEPVQFAIGFAQPETGDAMRAQELLGKTVTIRNAPTALGITAGAVLPREVINYYKVIDDRDHPGNPDFQWLQLDEAGTKFVNFFYPSTTQSHLQRFTLLDVYIPPVPTKTVAHTITVYTDGSLDVDGKPYSG